MKIVRVLFLSLVLIVATVDVSFALTLGAFGDSIMLGARTGVLPADTMVAKIGVACGFSTVVNKGVAGEDTGQTLGHFPADLAAANPDTVFLGSSPNDYAHGLTPAQSKANLLAMKTQAEATGAKVVFFTHIIWADYGYLHNSNGAPAERAMMQELGGMPGVQFVDIFAEQTRVLFYSGYVPGAYNAAFRAQYASSYVDQTQPDWIHPSKSQHQAQADFAMLNPAVCDHR